MRSAREFISTYEFRRKAVHLSIGVGFVFFFSMMTKFETVLLLSVGLVFSLIVSMIAKYWRPGTLLRILRLFDKPQDLARFPAKGAVYYITGILASVILFEKNVASASVLILAFGDPAGHFFGRYYGKHKIIINRKKLLEGSIAGTLFGTIGASFFVPWFIAFFGAAFGMIAEAIELEVWKLDDNFFIPIVSGAVMTLIYMAM